MSEGPRDSKKLRQHKPESMFFQDTSLQIHLRFEQNQLAMKHQQRRFATANWQEKTHTQQKALCDGLQKMVQIEYSQHTAHKGLYSRPHLANILVALREEEKASRTLSSKRKAGFLPGSGLMLHDTLKKLVCFSDDILPLQDAKQNRAIA